MSGRPPPEIPGYRHVRFLDHGGCSTVHLYVDLGDSAEHDREVAIKVLIDHGLPDLLKQQFIEEGRAMIKLANHPNIVQVLDAAVAPDGRRYIVMQYCPRPNMHKIVQRRPYPVDEALEIGVKVASAVEFAHRADILHRDIKPANILVDELEQPRLTDFGIAGRITAAGEDDVGLSVPWSPPEVLDKGTALRRSDVYSLAATVWHLLVGRSPFDLPGANSVAQIEARIRTAPRPVTGVPGVPPSLDRLLRRAMAIDPDQRPQTALEFAEELQGVELELGLSRTPVYGVKRQRAAGPPTPSTAEPQREPDGATRLGRGGPAAAAGPTSLRDPATHRFAEPDSATRPRAAPPTPVPGRPPVPETPAATRLRVTPAVEPAEVSEQRPRWVWPVVVAAGIVVAATVGVLRLIDDAPTAPDDGATSSQQPAGAAQDAGVPGGNVPPGTPTVVATRVDAATLHFTWTYSARLGSDSFAWRTEDGAQQGVAAAPELDLPSAAEACVQVKVVRADGSHAATDWSPAGCGS